MDTLLITGVHSTLGRAVARWAVEQGLRVVGVDVRAPAHPLPGITFVQTEVQNPLIPQLLKSEGVEAIFHAAFRWRIMPTPETFENNVVGTMKLMDAAADAGVKHVVFPSSALVYGAHPQHPPLLTETTPFRGPSRYGYVRDLRDIETFLQGFARQHEAMTITILRLGNMLGRHVTSPLARYLAQPVVPVLAGSNPFLSLLHVDDAVRAIQMALMHPHAGVFNVATQPPLPLRHILYLARRPMVALPLSVLLAGQRLSGLWGKKQPWDLPLPWEYLRYSWPLSTRHMTETWAFHPQYDAEATVRHRLT